MLTTAADRDPVRDSIKAALAKKEEDEAEVKSSFTKAIADQKVQDDLVRQSIQVAQLKEQTEMQAKMNATNGLTELRARIPVDTKWVRCTARGNQHFGKMFKLLAVVAVGDAKQLALADSEGLKLQLPWRHFAPLTKKEAEHASFGVQFPTLNESEKYLWANNPLRPQPILAAEVIHGEEDRLARIKDLERILPDKKSQLALLATEYTNLTGLEVKRQF